MTYMQQRCIHYMEVAHSVDSLVLDGIASYENLQQLDYEGINASYMSYIEA